jgi:hypothetical protein
VLGLAGVGVLLSLIAAINARPIVRLLDQFHLIAPDAGHRKDLSREFARHAGPMLARFRAVDIATALVIRRSGGRELTPEQAQTLDRLLQADEGNAAVAYMLAALDLMKPGPAPQRFQAATAWLRRSGESQTTTWYSTEIRETWSKVWQQEGLGQVEAMIRADLSVGFDHARALRVSGDAFLTTAAELEASGDGRSAKECYALVIDLGRGVVQQQTVPTMAMAAAELLETALTRRALLIAGSDAASAQSDMAASVRARKFLEDYRRAAERGPYNVLDPSARRSTRPTPYRQMMTSLLSTGAVATVSATAAILLCLSAAVLGIDRLLHGRATPPAMAVANRFWFLVGAGGIVLSPALVATGLFQAVPTHEEYWGSMTWVGKTMLGVSVLTVWAIMGLAGWWAARGVDSPSRTRRVWHWMGLLMGVLTVLCLLPQWSWYGPHETWFDQSWQLPWALARYDLLTTLPLVFGVLGGVVWSMAVFVQRSRARSEDREQRRLIRCRMVRGMLVLSSLGFAAGSGGALLAERTFYQYDRKHSALYVQDMSDEVAARLGPAWRANYFAPSEEAR